MSAGRDFEALRTFGLGRTGWISCRFPQGEAPDLDLMKRWISESYRAVAPRKLAAALAED